MSAEDPLYHEVKIGHVTHRLPIDVVLISGMPNEWPVSVIWVHDDERTTRLSHEVALAEATEAQIQRRLKSGNINDRETLKVFRARITDVVQVHTVPSRVLPPEIKSMDYFSLREHDA